jgi:hypothetical protein
MVKASRTLRNIFTTFTTKLSAKGNKATVQYFLSINKKLKKVLVSREPSEKADNLEVKLIEQFLNLRFPKLSPPAKHTFIREKMPTEIPLRFPGRKTSNTPINNDLFYCPISNSQGRIQIQLGGATKLCQLLM